jgi:hypothetical protein
LRVFAEADLDNFPRGIEEWETLHVMRLLYKDRDVRKSIHSLKEPPGGRWYTPKMMDYIRSTPYLMSWWRKGTGRVMKIKGMTEVLMETMGIYLTAYDLAHMRLPHTLAAKPEVVFTQARIQGLTAHTMCALYAPHPRNPPELRGPALLEGLRIWFSDPWVEFSLVAPFMSQFGMKWPIEHLSWTENVARMEFLLNQPMKVTGPEIEVIRDSQVYEIAREHMRDYYKFRKGDSHNIKPSRAVYAHREGNIPKGHIDEWCTFARGNLGNQEAVSLET